MGICSSKQASDTKSVHAASPTPDEPAEGKAVGPTTDAAAAAAPAAGGADGESLASSQDYPRTPFHEGRATDADDISTPQMHTYHSAEKPARSAMRPSMDGKSPGTYSRKSSSGLSSVVFNVNMDAPEAETSETHLTGGNSISLKKIVDMFYDKVLADAELAPFFEKIDMQKLKTHQVRFMGLAFGGKDLVFEEDPNLNLRKVHYRLIRDKGLNLDHWEKFVGLFDKTLGQLERDIPAGTRDAAMRSIHATKHYFVPIGEETPYTNKSIAALPIPGEGDAAAAAVEQPQVQA